MSITALGDLDVGSVTAAGQAVTLSATGALHRPEWSCAQRHRPKRHAERIIDRLPPAIHLETQVSSSITATATGGGIYISDLGTGTSYAHRDGVGTGGQYRFHQRGQHRPDDGHRPGQYGHPDRGRLDHQRQALTRRRSTSPPRRSILSLPAASAPQAIPWKCSWPRWPPRTADANGVFMDNAGPLADRANRARQRREAAR